MVFYIIIPAWHGSGETYYSMFSMMWYSTENGKPAEEHRWTETVSRFLGQHERRTVPQERTGQNEGLPRRKESKKTTIKSQQRKNISLCALNLKLVKDNSFQAWEHRKKNFICFHLQCITKY